jgi:hypothetical protein
MPRFLDGCQLVAVTLVTGSAPAKRPGVMRAIKGDIGAATAKRWNRGEKIAIEQKDCSKRSPYP